MSGIISAKPQVDPAGLGYEADGQRLEFNSLQGGGGKYHRRAEKLLPEYDPVVAYSYVPAGVTQS